MTAVTFFFFFGTRPTPRALTTATSPADKRPLYRRVGGNPTAFVGSAPTAYPRTSTRTWTGVFLGALI